MTHKMTEQTRDKLLAQLEEMKTVLRPQVAERIKEARSFGDLSENSEYDEAKNEQAKLESKIEEIEYLLSTSKLIHTDEIKTDVIDVGCVVTLYDKTEKEEVVFYIVGSTEADPLNNKISDESPIGTQLIGHKKGETVNVSTPAGVLSYKILDIGLSK